jgi:hypothetical protein
MRRCGVIMVALITTSGCGRDTSAPIEPPAAVPTTISLSVSSLSFPSLRISQSVTATVRDQQDNTMPAAAVSWATSDSAVATVSGSGVVTSIGNGTATITATAGAAAASVPVVVAQIAAGMTLSRDTVRFDALGDTSNLSVTVTDANAQAVAGAVVQWSSSDTAIATVSDAGAVRAIGNGSTLVTAKAGELTTSAAVVVSQVSAVVVLSADTVRFSALADTTLVTALVLDRRGEPVTAPAMQWSSSDTSIAVVQNGRITARRNGTASIVARAEGATGSATVIVRQVPASVGISGDAKRTIALADTLRVAADARDANGWAVTGAVIDWSSSDTTVARVSAAGLITAVRRGAATISASAAGTTSSAVLDLSVVPVRIETVPAYLATPAPGALWEIPVVIVRYIPTLDDVTVDAGEAGMPGTLDAIRKRIEVFEERVKFMLEEGSRFRGYQDPAAPYSIGYRVLHIVTVFSHFQRGREVPWLPGQYFPDYHQILGQIDARHWVNERGVKEFWVWGYHSDNFQQPESNMSSPITGDISNSSRFADDLPVFNHTYTVYGYNFARTQAEAVHNHGHQLEALLGHVDRGLFWREFVGRNADDTGFITGRAGWTHMPPNTTKDYDYLNGAVVPSDIADWRPGGGEPAPVSAATWAGAPYDWPSARLPGESQIFQRTESQWYMYWMQSMPGRGNTIPHGSGVTTNWWRLTGDWDGAIRDDYGLSTAPATIVVRNDFRGGILLVPGGGLEPGQSVTLRSSLPIRVGVYDCGEPGETTCILDQYTLTPGRRYRVIEHPAGPVNNLTIVEQ